MRRVLILASAALCVFLGLSVWGVAKIIAWASDLPNRVDVHVDGESVAWFITESARAALQQPDPETQFESLKALADGIESNPEVVPWIRAELGSDIDTLRGSSDPKVAALAEDIHAKFSLSRNSQAGE